MKTAYLPARNLSDTVQWQPRRPLMERVRKALSGWFG